MAIKFTAKKKTPKQSQEPEKTQTAQSAVYQSKPEGIDFVAPSIIKELLPTDVSEGITVDDYMVEIGGTSVLRRYYRSYFAEILSGNTWGGMLDELARGNFGNGDLDIAIHVKPASTDRELNELGRRLRGLLSDLVDEGDPTKIDAIRDEINDIKARQRKLRMEIERSFKVVIQVIASGTDLKEFKMYCNALVKRFAGKSIYLRPADGKQLEALLGIVPISKSADFMMNEHFITLESSNLADLFPFSQGGISHKTGVILGRDAMNRPVYFDQWDPRLPNQHMIIIGRSGAGKTYATQIIMHRSMHIGRMIAVLDWKGEHKDFFMLNGLPYIEFSETSPDRINPYELEVSVDVDGTRYVDIESVANNVQGLVFKMISIYDRSVLTGKVKVFIGEAIRKQYEELGITKDPKNLYQKRFVDGQLINRKKEMPELGGLYLKMAQSELEEIKTAAEMLKPFTKYGTSPSYSIFDGQSSITIKNAPGYGFAVNKLDKEIMRPIALAAIAQWLNENFAKSDITREKIIFIEECQNIFDDPDVGGPFAETAYREYRATNTGICSVTQGLEVLSRSNAGVAAVKNSPIKIIGKQEPYDIEAIRGQLHLTEGEASFLVGAQRGQVILKIEDESDIVFTEASDWEHVMFTTNPNDPAFYKRKEILKEKFSSSKEMMGSGKA